MKSYTLGLSKHESETIRDMAQTKNNREIRDALKGSGITRVSGEPLSNTDVSLVLRRDWNIRRYRTYKRRVTKAKRAVAPQVAAPKAANLSDFALKIVESNFSTQKKVSLLQALLG